MHQSAPWPVAALTASLLLLLSSCVVPTSSSPEPIPPPVYGSMQWTVSPLDAGTVEISPDSARFPLGTLVSLDAQANPGYYFHHWEGASTETAPRIDWVADGDRAVVAVFGDRPRLSFEVFPENSGSIASSVEGPFFDPDATVILTQTPAEGFVFDHWEIDGEVVEGTTANTLEVTMDASHGARAFFTENEWTILLYIAGGNELAPQALSALRQLETTDLRESKITVLALVDRASGYDGAWSGTRLYKVQYDTSGNGVPSSVELDSAELGLVANQKTNLDMGDPDTLKELIRTAKNRYSAAHYGVIFWGHGTGWRSAVARSGERAVGIDDDSGNSMLYTTEIALGLSAIAEGSPSQKFGIIGMDLCFGSMIETLVEVAPYGKYFVGSAGLVPTNGWRYDLALPAFRDLADRSPLAGAGTFFTAFQTTYQALPGSMISVVDLAEVAPLATAWNAWASSATSGLTNDSLRSATRASLFLHATGYYTTPGDLNLDMGDVLDKVALHLPSVDKAPVVTALAQAVKSHFTNVVIPNTTTLAPAHGIAVHFVPLGSDQGPSLPFDDGYVRDKGAPNTPAFVTNSTWVPSVAGTGFLDAIWKDY